LNTPSWSELKLTYRTYIHPSSTYTHHLHLHLHLHLHPAIHMIQPHVAQRGLPSVALTGDPGDRRLLGIGRRTALGVRVSAITEDGIARIDQHNACAVQNTDDSVLWIIQQIPHLVLAVGRAGAGIHRHRRAACLHAGLGRACSEQASAPAVARADRLNYTRTQLLKHQRLMPQPARGVLFLCMAHDGRSTHDLNHCVIKLLGKNKKPTPCLLRWLIASYSLHAMDQAPRDKDHAISE
jgi:hypothetical protein